MRVAITGSSGLVGSELVCSLEAGGHQVRRLLRVASSAAGCFHWDPRNGRIDARAFEGVDAVVNLAGANIAEGRWSESRKRLIRDSRVQGTKLIVRAISDARNGPTVLLNASAVGCYGDAGDVWLDEGSPFGSGFLASVCREWESAAEAAMEAGIRVTTLRTGVVLATGGGALARLLPVFRSGLGGPLGRGRMWMSWITIGDTIRAIEHLLFHECESGPVNLVAPFPVTNEAFAKSLALALGRPAVLRAPAWALRMALGQMADEILLASARVRPTRLLKAGFIFRQPSLEDAWGHLLGTGD